MTTIGERIRTLRGRLSRDRFAVSLGKSPKTIERWEKGQTEPSEADLRLIVHELGVRLHWLKTGEGPIREPQPRDHNGTAPVASHVEASVIRYPYHTIGERGEAGNHAADELVRTESEVYRLTGLSAKRLKAFFVVGDSMLPEIQPNTPALYLPVDRIEGSGKYILILDDLTVVKVVDVMAGGAIRISSLNKSAYPDSEILKPIKHADTPNTYRSEVTDLTCTVKVEGRVVMYTKAT